MNMFNYLLIGVIFTFLCDIIIHIARNNPIVQEKLKNWGLWERIVCILVWPLGVLVFTLSFIKEYLKK
jgi:hypothetical protein